MEATSLLFTEGAQTLPAHPAATPVRFFAGDGYELGGILYARLGDAAPEHAVVFNCGAGIPAVCYQHFARFLASRGLPILTYDYRGIALSHPGTLRGFSAIVEDWSQYDCDGAIAWMRTRYPAAQLTGVAHSVGALLFGGADHSAELARYAFIGPHTGYWRDYRPRHRLPMALLWHGVMPALTRAWGYFPASWLGLGDDIPAGIALQWAARRTPQVDPSALGHSADEARQRRVLARFREVRGSVLALSTSDDAFATEEGAGRLLACYPGLRAERARITPGEAGLRALGHFGFFRRAAGTSLWPKLCDWLQRPDGRWEGATASGALHDTGSA